MYSFFHFSPFYHLWHWAALLWIKQDGWGKSSIFSCSHCTSNCFYWRCCPTGWFAENFEFHHTSLRDIRFRLDLFLHILGGIYRGGIMMWCVFMICILFCKVYYNKIQVSFFPSSLPTVISSFHISRHTSEIYIMLFFPWILPSGPSLTDLLKPELVIPLLDSSLLDENLTQFLPEVVL